MSQTQDPPNRRTQDFFHDVYPSLHRYCLRLTGDADAADDAAQEAFVRMFERGPQEEGPTLRLWLFRVATNLVRDRARVRSGREHLLRKHGARLDVEPSPEEALERRESQALVRRVLDRLPERDQQMLLMREEGFRYREIAGAVGVRPGSVGTLLARAEARFVRAHAAVTREGKA